MVGGGDSLAALWATMHDLRVRERESERESADHPLLYHRAPAVLTGGAERERERALTTPHYTTER